MNEKQKRLIQQVRILTMTLAAGVITLSLQTLWTKAEIFQYAALGLTIFSLGMTTLILKRIVKPNQEH